MIKRNALICGSTQGIGLASAQALAKSGYSCVLLARNEASLKSVVATLDVSQGQEHQYLVADFSNPSALKIFEDELISNQSKMPNQQSKNKRQWFSIWIWFSWKSFEGSGNFDVIARRNDEAI